MRTNLENPKERNHLGDLGMERKIIVKWILNKYSLRTWTVSVTGAYEHGIEHSVSNKSGNLSS
jgi:hypothetical protein